MLVEVSLLGAIFTSIHVPAMFFFVIRPVMFAQRASVCHDQANGRRTTDGSGSRGYAQDARHDTTACPLSCCCESSGLASALRIVFSHRL